MSAIKERVLKLPVEEKIDLFYALKNDLRLGSDVLDNDGLSAEQWAEVKRREALIESGEATWIDQEELENLLRERTKVLQHNQE